MKRATKYEINSIISTVAVLAIIVFVLLISDKHHHRFDFTKNKKHSLADQTINILKKLDVKVKATAFFSKGFPQEQQARDLLTQYQYTNPRFSFEIIDPDKRPTVAKEYEISAAGVIVVECGTKKEKVRDITEEALTNGIVKVTTAGKKKVYFVTGHNELSIDERGGKGISLFKDSLEKEVYEAKTLDFAKDKSVPMDAAAVVVAGPEKPFAPQELEILKTWLNNGGRAFILLGISSTKDLNGLLSQFAFKIGDDMVIDEVSMLFGGDAATLAILPPDGYGNHAIVEKFRMRCFFPLTRSITTEPSRIQGAVLSELAFSSQAAYAESNIEMLKKGKYKFDKKEDRAGRMCVAAAGTYPAAQAASPPDKSAAKPAGKEGRIVVWGSSMALNNSTINEGGNRDFALNSVGWLSEEENLISIRPKDEKAAPITMDLRQMALVFISVLLVPAFIVFMGIWVKIRRR